MTDGYVWHFFHINEDFSLYHSHVAADSRNSRITILSAKPQILISCWLSRYDDFIVCRISSEEDRGNPIGDNYWSHAHSDEEWQKVRVM